VSERPRFHLAFPVHDLGQAREFYVNVLGCSLGRSSERWVDFDFHGHQIVAHLVEDGREHAPQSPVDGDQVPASHFGVILPWEEWEQCVEGLRRGGANFLIGPRVRFEGLAGEQATVFFADPSGNALELKAFRDPEAVFASDLSAPRA
jgi:extradiol dioxygenase family protein